jgi:hypothetical protein
MQVFLTNFKFIIGFIVLVFLVQLALGNKASENFSIMVLFTMIILNADNFTNFLSEYF